MPHQTSCVNAVRPSTPFHIRVLLLLTILMNPAVTQENVARRSSNPHFRPGEWVSYGVTRFVTSVAVGHEEVYFGTTGGIASYDVFRDRWKSPLTVSDGLPANIITVVAFDAGTGFLWCGTSQGVSYLHPSSNRWTNIYKDELGLDRFDDIVAIGIADAEIWFETRSGILRRGDKFGGAIGPAVRDSAAPGNGRWFGARLALPAQYPQFFMSRGYLFDPRGEVQDFHLRHAKVTAAVQDGWGHMWLGTWGLGAVKADLQVERAEALEFGLGNRRVDAIALADNALWIGGQADEIGTGAITRWDQRHNTWEYFAARYNNDIVSDEVNNFAVAGEKIYCATRYGVGIFDTRRNRWRRLTVFDGLEKENVNDIALDADYLWVASDGGLNRVTLKSIGTDSVEVIELAAGDLHLVAVYDLEKVSNLLWAATEAGAYVFDTATNTGGFVADAEGPRHEVVTAVTHFQNEIWFGTLRAIEAYDTEKKAWLATPARQLYIAHPVNCLAADSSAIWAGTDHGVMRYHRRTRDWQQYTVTDGLLENQVNAIALDRDIVWFGTNRGLTGFRWQVPGRID